MRNQLVKWIAGATMTMGLAMLFTQCDESELMVTPTRNTDQAIELRSQNAPVDFCTCLATEFIMEDLSTAERDILMFMREEEKLARDVYLQLYELWGHGTFANIARSEQNHMDAVRCLITRYDLPDPVGDDVAGTFQDTALQAMYNDLMTAGRASLVQALTVGATIEDVDIKDLLDAMADPDVDNDDILAVFGNLLRGSRNHMRAFTFALDNLGATYTPQYIDADLFDEILAGEMERGEGVCGDCSGGKGNVNGPGQYGNRQGNYGQGTCDYTSQNRRVSWGNAQNNRQGNGN